MQKTYFKHLEDPKAGRHATICASRIGETNQFNIGMSIKSPRDKNYNRKLGNKIALGRAVKKPLYVYTIGDSKEGIKNLINSMTTNGIQKLKEIQESHG